MILPKSTLLALLPFFLATPSLAVSGNGKTTRYWDCCKPSCSWSDKASFSTGPVETCDKNNNVLADVNAKSGCENGGSAFMCGDQTPWAVSDSLAYGFAAVSIAGGTEASWCCACYELTFTSGPVSGKKMIVQATNTGGDLGSNHFDINMPGGGFGIFNGCTPQYGTPSTGWGEQYGGISSRSQCDAFPAALKAGCNWRFDWFKNADNPAVSFKSVACPRALTNKTGCVRSDDSPIGDANVPTAGANVPAASSKVPTASSKVPTPDANVPAASSKVPTPDANVPTPDANVPTPDANVPTPDANVPTPDANVPTAGANVPTAVTNVPSAGGSVPTVGGGGGSCQMPGTGATVAKYGQCGGKGYTGATTCAAGSTCKESNPWYSQCL